MVSNRSAFAVRNAGTPPGSGLGKVPVCAARRSPKTTRRKSAVRGSAATATNPLTEHRCAQFVVGSSNVRTESPEPTALGRAP